MENQNYSFLNNQEDLEEVNFDDEIDFNEDNSISQKSSLEQDSENNVTFELLKMYIKENTTHSNIQVINLLKNLNVYDVIYTWGENLLHWTCAFNNVKICEFLITEKKLHINLENFRGVSPLHYACLTNNKEVIKVMLNYYADPLNRSGSSGLFPRDETNDISIKKLLKNHENEFMPLDFSKSNPTIKSSFHVTSAYYYRLYRYWLSHLNLYLNKNKFSYDDHYAVTLSGLIENEEIKKIYNEQGISYLAEKCQDLYNKFISSVKLAKNTKNIKICLFCDKLDELKMCKGCNRAYFCSRECQKGAFEFHKLDCHS